MTLMLRSSCAKWRSPASGRGSSHGRFRSLGMLSINWLAWACRNSRRSLARVDCWRAARCRDPSGFLTILIGSMSLLPLRLVCPRRKLGSVSASSTSVSSSVSSTASIPCSGSKVGYCSTGKTPDLMSCCASKSSCSVRACLVGRNPLPARLASRRSAARSLSTSRPGWTTAVEDRDAFVAVLVLMSNEDAEADADEDSIAAVLRKGIRSRPVFWSTSLMDRISFLSPELVSVMETSLTHTDWPFRKSRRS
mmetsp:Transcript_1352/g.3461  ORF Transcript_1352/g.3461 Transcript_1352/m.3461 type:complete len:251 (-) Transcript_1352:860-1612(-)